MYQMHGVNSDNHIILTDLQEERKENMPVRMLYIVKLVLIAVLL